MIGDKIRKIRKDRAMTLSDLSNETDLSISYISQLERGLIEPSVSSLRKISKALNTPIYLFVEDDLHSEGLVVKKQDRAILNFAESTVCYEIASATSKPDMNVEMLLVAFNMSPKTADSDNFITHPSDELVLVTEGEMEVTVGGVITILSPGDTMYIKGNSPHRFRNTTNENVRGYTIFSPPAWPIQK